MTIQKIASELQTAVSWHHDTADATVEFDDGEAGFNVYIGGRAYLVCVTDVTDEA